MIMRLFCIIFACLNYVCVGMNLAIILVYYFELNKQLELSNLFVGCLNLIAAITLSIITEKVL